MPLFAGPGVTPNLRGNTTNVIGLEPGSVYPLSVPGWYETKTGLYSCLQEWDPVTLMWRSVGAGSASANLERIYSDGNNYRIANFSGCAVGANLTAAGSGYTIPPVVTASAGNSIWRAIVGGAINITVTVQNGGANYTYAPIVLFAAPPPGGIQATGFCTLTAGAVTSVTVIDQGAGYNAPPPITFMNDPREGANGVPVGFGAAAIATLTGAGTVTGVLCIDPGQAITNSTVPTLTFTSVAGTGAAATALMSWGITAYAVTSGGTYTAAQDVILTAFNKSVTIQSPGPLPASAYQNPTTQQGLVRQRTATIIAALSGTAVTATGQKVVDAGVYSVAATGLAPILSSNGPVTTAAVVTLTMGGLSDTSLVLTT